MSYQLLGLRDYQKNGKAAKKDAFYEKKWNIDDPSEIFKDPQRILDRFPVPVEERYNLYWTVADSAGRREFRQQKFIPYDIDDIDVTRAKETIQIAVKALGLSYDETYSLFSGNGVQFFVELERAFDDPAFFDENRVFYKSTCSKIDRALRDAQLPGEADPSVFSLARLMRFPGTLNVKPDKETRIADVMNSRSRPIAFNLREAAGMPEVSKEEVIVRWPAPDTEAVLQGCENIKQMWVEPNSISEGLWYGLASIFGNLKDGRDLWHKYSSRYAKYDAGEADRKLDQAIAASKPRTCKNFSTLPGSVCFKCPNKDKYKSPILIIGPDHIKTEATGFHKTVVDAEGNTKLGKPAYADLLTYFEKTHPYVVNHDSETIYTHNGTHYNPLSPLAVKAFAEDNFADCTTQKAAEFSSKVMRNNGVSREWFESTTVGRMNFKNGVLDVSTGEFKLGHTTQDGFLYVLPYDYNPDASAPKFEQYLFEVTQGDIELQQQLLEFAGYCFSNDTYWCHKALLLVGYGRNGKSTFLEVLRAVADQGYSAISLRHLQDPQFLAPLEGVLFNISEESSSTAFKETDIFKTLTAGGEIMVKTVYERPHRIRNRAKLIVSCNEIPSSFDSSHGYFSRFSIVPFNVTFTQETMDTGLLAKLVAERAGILNMFLKAYRQMKERGYLLEATSSLAVREDYREDMDLTQKWIDENCIIKQEWDETCGSVSTQDFYSSYSNFCELNGINPPPSGAFFQKIKNYIKDYPKRRCRPDKREPRRILGVTLRKQSF